MDLPSEPEESGRPEQASAGVERLSPKSRELPDPDERGRVYEATRAHAEAECGGTSRAGFRVREVLE